MARKSILISLALLLTPFVHAKEKKQPLPDFVLQAQTAAVVIEPDATEPVNDPVANRRAQDDVEVALAKWGRYRIILDAHAADLVFAVRCGRGAVSPTINGPTVGAQPVILQPDSNGDIRGRQRAGLPPDIAQTPTGRDTSPHVATEVGSSEDTLEVYNGHMDFPLDFAPLWRYWGKDALRPPTVLAVDQFRKAVEESEKIAQQRKQKQP
jgi:hypothetical protein